MSSFFDTIKILQTSLLIVLLNIISYSVIYASDLNLEESKSYENILNTEAIRDTPGEQTAHDYYLSSSITGYYVYLPKDYDANSGKVYPMVLFLHGAGEVGTNLSLVKRNGPPRMVDQGEDFPFILVSPQARYTWDHNGSAIDQFVEQMKKDYRVDDNRFYVTGLSMGGAATWNYTTDYDYKVAASVPICGWGNPSRACEMKDVPVWAFHNRGDGTVGVGGTLNMINALKNCSADPLMTIYERSGHNAWTQTYNNDAMWDWMLSQSKNGIVQTPNRTPVAHAGNNKTLTLPNNSLTLYGSGSDADGWITSYQWVKTAGPRATMTDANKTALKLSNLAAGNYTFKLTVKDNKNSTAYDEVRIVVNEAPQAPISSSGTISINFNNGSNQSSPWNNINANPYTNKKVANLKDNKGQTTSASLVFLSSWGGTGTNRIIPNSIYPSNVSKTYYWTASPNKESLKLTGLDNSKTYSFTFFGSRNGTGNRTTEYSIGSKTVSLNASNNSSVASITNVSPNNNGEIYFYVKRGEGSTFGYLNALVITPSDNQETSIPSSSNDAPVLNATVQSSSEVKVSWKHNTSLDTDYEIYRSSGINGVYYKIRTIANAYSYMDKNLDANLRYNYKIRAKNSKGYSAFSNVISISSTTNSGSNTSIPQADEVVYRINAGGSYYSQDPKNWGEDSRSKPSQYLSDVYSASFDHYTWGDRKNSTQAPDYIFKSNRYGTAWGNKPLAYSLPLTDGKYKVNLYFAEYEYSSISGKGQRLFHVSIENKRVLSNFDIYAEAGRGAVQKSFTVDVTDGKLDLKFERVVSNPQINGIEVIRVSSINSSFASSEMQMNRRDLNSKANEAENLFGKIKAYPNPIIDNFTLELSSEKNQTISIKFFDLSGKLFDTKQYQLWKGNNTINIQANNIDDGLFILRIEFENGRSQTQKLIKK